MTWTTDPNQSRWLSRLEPDDSARLDLVALINDLVNRPEATTPEAVELRVRQAFDGRSPEDARRLIDAIDEVIEMARDLKSGPDAAAVLEALVVFAAMHAAAG